MVEVTNKEKLYVGAEPNSNSDPVSLLQQICMKHPKIESVERVSKYVLKTTWNTGDKFRTNYKKRTVTEVWS